MNAPPPPDDPGAALRQAVRDALVAAQRARDGARVGACRSIITAVDNAEAVEARQGHEYGDRAPALGTREVPRRRLTVAEVRTTLGAMLEETDASARGYRDVGQHAAATALEAEAAAARDVLVGITWLG